MLTRGKLTEVLCRLWDDIVVQFEDDTTQVLLVDRDIKLQTVPAQ